MSRIRIVGKARGGRCVYCHDSLSSEIDRCPECHATWHADCAPPQATRCPTIGCAGPAPAHASRPAGRRDRARHAARTSGVGSTTAPRAGPAWARRTTRPGFFARVGPYSRLVLSGLWNAAVVLGVVAVVLWAVSHPGDLWHFLSTGKRGSHIPAPFALLQGLLMAGMLALFGWLAGRWLLRLPGVVAELHELFERTDPVLMDLTVYSTGSGKKKKWWARLRGRHGEVAGQTHELELDGILPPWWLTTFSRAGEPVLVYGLPPPGPYVLEFESGALALVHPDE